LEASRDVRRVADHCLLLRRASADEIANHHKPGRDRDPHLNPFGARFEPLYCSNHVEPGSHGALGVILVGAGIAKIGEHAIAHEPGDVAVVNGNDVGAGGPVGADHLPHVLWIEASGDLGRTYQIAEHHGEMASLGIVPVSLLKCRLWSVEFGDSAKHLAAMAEQDS
jgi:hypothetical protein